MNTNFRKFITDIEKMQDDKRDSITYNTLVKISEDLMLDELLLGECDPVEFLADTLINIKKKDMIERYSRRLSELKEEKWHYQKKNFYQHITTAL